MISIVIPVYNVEPYIEDCLRSVARQSVTQGVECILVDDCGTDRSFALAEQFVAAYQGAVRFKLVRHRCNRGLSAARNTGIQAASGEYVYLLDSDDEILPDTVEGLLAIIARHPGIDLIQALFEHDSPYMHRFTPSSIPAWSDNRRQIKRMLLDYDRLPVTAANKCVRRRLVLDHDIWFKEGIIHEDNHWSFFLAKHVATFALYPKRCYLYRTVPGSISTAPRRDKEMKAFHTMLEDFAANIDPFLPGEQKKSLLKVFLSIKSRRLYDSESQLTWLSKQVYGCHNLLEKALIRIQTKSSSSVKFRKSAQKCLNFLYCLG